MSDTDPLVAALGRVVSGIYILTIGEGDDATGMLASWVQQAGFEPPMVTVCVGRDRRVAERITDGQPFAINVVGAGQKHLLRHFGRGFEPGEPAFEGVETRAAESGVTALADAVAVLECEPTAHVDSGDHRVFLARVTGGSVSSDEAPMTHVRKRGDHY